MCHRNIVWQRWGETAGSSGATAGDSPAHRASPQLPVRAPGGRSGTPPDPPAPGGWSAAAGPLLLSPSQRSWCTAAGSRPGLRDARGRTGKTLWVQRNKMISLLAAGSRTLFEWRALTGLLITFNARNGAVTVKCKHGRLPLVCVCVCVCASVHIGQGIWHFPLHQQSE